MQQKLFANYLSLRQFASANAEVKSEDPANTSDVDLLYESAAAMFSQLQIGSLCAEVVRQACRLMHTDNGFIYIVNQEEGVLELSFGMGIYSVYAGVTRCKEEPSVSSVVWRTGQPLAVNNLDQWEGKAKDRPHGWDVVKSVLGIPLYSGFEVTAVVGLGFEVMTRKFTVKELDMLSRFAALTAIALQNAQIFKDLQQKISAKGKVSNTVPEARSGDLYGQELLLATPHDGLSDNHECVLADHSKLARHMWHRAQQHLADAYLSAEGKSTYNARHKPDRLPDLLTEREITVLKLMSDGLSNQEIAVRIGVKVSTVKTHAHHVYNKLGVKRRVQALVRAREYSFI